MAIRITDPKDFARHITPSLLVQFLQQVNPPVRFIPSENKDVKTNKKQRISPEDLDEFIKAVSESGVRDYIFNEISYINELSSDRHTIEMQTIASAKSLNLNYVEYQKCVNQDERSLWWYLNSKETFNERFQRADTENLAGIKEFKIKPERVVAKEEIIKQGKLDLFGAEVFKLYKNTFRGDNFKVSYFERENEVLIRVYLENLPSTELVFADKGKDITLSGTIKSLFSIVIIYNQKEKTLGIRANRPQENVPKIQEAFCKVFLNCKPTDLDEFTFNIKDAVEKIDITLDPINDREIERVYLKAVEYEVLGDVTGKVIVDIGAKNNPVGIEPMQKMLQRLNINEKILKPSRYEVKFVFRNENNSEGRRKYITASVSKKNINLRATKEDEKIRRFLRDRGFIN